MKIVGIREAETRLSRLFDEADRGCEGIVLAPPLQPSSAGSR